MASRSAAFFFVLLLAAPVMVLAFPVQDVSAAATPVPAPTSAQPVLRGNAPPLPDVEGCYTDTLIPSSGQYRGWQSVPCATPQQVANLPHPTEGNNNHPGIYGIQSQPKAILPILTITPILESAFVGVWELGNFATETDTIQGSGYFSIQLNTNQFKGSNGHTDGVQFTIQTIPGSDTFVCVWNVDATAQTYPKTCVTAPWSGASWPTGDCGTCAAIIYGTVVPGFSNSQGFRPTVLEAQAQMPWVGGILYGVVAGDYHGLQSNWLAGSGTILGQGGGSEAVFTATDPSQPVTITQVTTSTCQLSSFWNCSIILSQHGGLIKSGVTSESNNLFPVPVFGPNGGTEPISPVCFEDGCYLQFASTLQPATSAG